MNLAYIYSIKYYIINDGMLYLSKTEKRMIKYEA